MHWMNVNVLHWLQVNIGSGYGTAKQQSSIIIGTSVNLIVALYNMNGSFNNVCWFLLLPISDILWWFGSPCHRLIRLDTEVSAKLLVLFINNAPVYIDWGLQCYLFLK